MAIQIKSTLEFIKLSAHVGFEVGVQGEDVK